MANENFKVSPRILSHLGEDLIKSEDIALLELVKNAYDANATLCSVFFEFNKDRDKLEKIIIEDNGDGMSAYIIKNIWLVIGTEYKHKQISKSLNNNNTSKRIPLGEKGIGRLGVHKLGEKILLISRRIDSKEVELAIDWSKLREIDNIDDFKVLITENDTPKYFKSKTGTKIIISELKSEWNNRQIRNVHRSINSLNSPFDEVNDDFKVNISSNSDIFKGLPEFKDIIGTALYFGKATIAGDKIVNIEYKFKPWETLLQVKSGREKTTKDFQSYELELKNYSGKKEIPIDLSKFKIGKIEFDIAIFDLDSQIFSWVNTEKTSVKEYLKENGGIRVYRDGVRVYDYGEKDNDWLGIDIRRVHRLGGNISNHIVIGSVKINRLESLDLKEKTNREGFVENEAYQAFVDAINYTLDLIVNERNEDKARLTTLYKKHKVMEPVLSDLDELLNLVREKVSEDDLKQDIIRYIYRINKQYTEVKEILIKSANAGLNLSVVIHEIEKLIASLFHTIDNNQKEKALSLSKQLEKIIQGYSILIKSSKIKKGLLSSIVKTAVDNYEFRFEDHKIEILLDSTENLEAYYAKSEAIAVLTNLLDNSIFWLSYSRTPNASISLYVTDKIIKGHGSIVVSDNGPGFGLPTDIAIKPFITKKPNSIGSGLGLHIADEIMKAMKGKMLFLDEQDINFPGEVIEKGATKAIVALCFPMQ